MYLDNVHGGAAAQRARQEVLMLTPSSPLNFTSRLPARRLLDPTWKSEEQKMKNKKEKRNC